MNKTKNSIVKVKASALKVGDMVEVDTGEDFNSRGFVEITEIWEPTYGMIDIELDELDDLGEKRIEAFKPDEIMKVRKPISKLTKAEHKKAIKKLTAKVEALMAEISAHEAELDCGIRIPASMVNTGDRIWHRKQWCLVTHAKDYDSGLPNHRCFWLDIGITLSAENDEFLKVRVYDELQVGERDTVLVKTKKVAK